MTDILLIYLQSIDAFWGFQFAQNVFAVGAPSRTPLSYKLLQLVGSRYPSPGTQEMWGDILYRRELIEK